MARAQQRAQDLTARIIGIDDQQHTGLEFAHHRQKQLYELVEQGASVTVGEHHPFVDMAGQWHAQEMPQRTTDQQPQRLKRMTEDIGRLGVILRALMQLLHRGHFLAFLGDLQPIANHHQPPAKTQWRE